MTTLLPNSQACSQVETYEDMFKEISRKLYGEISEANQSLHTPAAQIATGSIVHELSDRNLALSDFDNGGVGVENVGSLKNDEHLTAFGLALMQNGFHASNSILNSQTFHQISKQNYANSISSSNLSPPCNVNSTLGQSNTSGEIISQKSNQDSTEVNLWNLKSENCQQPQKQFKNKKLEIRENSMMLHSPNNILPNDSKSPNDLNGCASGIAIQQTNVSIQKRYNCSNCPYATDRRDLFTRHENIHKEDKPFHCYVCLKQFNRADHVKKHFLRMHRGLNYDIVRTKRSLPQKTKKNSGFYNHSNNTNSSLNMSSTFSLQNQQIQQSQTSMIDHTNPHLGNIFRTNTGVSNHHNVSQQTSVKIEKSVEKTTKKSDKIFMCCYCSWSGSDNWGLKRHLNTHTKPFVCVLCDYKAARSERLATHVFKVHNKKVCTKCNYLAENQTEYNSHINDAHANETRSQRSNPVTNSSDLRSATNTILRSVNNSLNTNNSFNVAQGPSTSTHAFNNWRTIISGAGGSDSSTTINRTNGSSNINQKKGAERLFQYFEADDSDPEDYARQLQMAAISRNTQAVAQDFHNAGGGKTMGVQCIKNSLRKNNCCKMNGQKIIINEFLHSTVIRIKINGKNSKNIVADLGLTKGPSVSPPAKKNQNFIKQESNLFDYEYEKENNLVLYEVWCKKSFDKI